MDAILSMLGLAQKAGRIASGEFATEKAVRSGRANLILLTEDASANTQKKITDMANTTFSEVYVCRGSFCKKRKNSFR